jgi:hypothetical protein
MNRKGRLCRLVLVALITAAALVPPALSGAHGHGRFYVGIGPGWWGPWWGPGWAYPAYPVYPYAVPAPCRDFWKEGRWEHRGRTDAEGFTTYHRVWVPGHWERVCP